MKSQSIYRQAGGIAAALFLSAAARADDASIDGVRDAAEGYATLSTQTVLSSFGGNALASISAKQEGANLLVHIAGKADNNAIILFLDTKPGGKNIITNNTASPSGDSYQINNLGTSSTTGPAFESGFGADYAIRIYGGGTNAYVNFFNLDTGAGNYLGDSSASTLTGPVVAEIKTVWSNDTTFENYPTLDKGVEMSLSLAGLGVPAATGQTIKMTALLLNSNSDYASNQFLGPVSRTGDIGGGIKSIDLGVEPGVQTLSITVDNDDADGDGIPNSVDDDDDNDGLPDIYETDDGIYVSPTRTGTDPLIADTDGDGASDADEIQNDFFGFLSNPNVANYASIAIPGSYTNPQWDVTGSTGADTEMTMLGESLTDQYEWRLNYNFQTLGAIEYKFAADDSYTHSWGDGGNNAQSLIQSTGFHTFAFNNSTLAHSLARTVFPDVVSYLAAYGLSDSSADDDGDNLTNAAEFAINTDPTNPDTDGDGVNDDSDSSPLLATRDIVFSVNMSVQTALGNFTPGTDHVFVDFFSGAAGGLADLALSPAGDGIWTGTLSNFAGPTGANFGEYKFKTDHPGAADSGYEGAIGNRSFTLGPANETQALGTVFFNDRATAGQSYADWAAANAGGESAAGDHDNDGVANGVEYFMGETGSSFTAGPTLANGVFSVRHSASATGVTWRIRTSPNLVDWSDATGATEADGILSYTLPTAAPKLFVRLEIAAP